jgi:hypothetical protein
MSADDYRPHPELQRLAFMEGSFTGTSRFLNPSGDEAPGPQLELHGVWVTDGYHFQQTGRSGGLPFLRIWAYDVVAEQFRCWQMRFQPFVSPDSQMQFGWACEAQQWTGNFEDGRLVMTQTAPEGVERPSKLSYEPRGDGTFVYRLLRPNRFQPDVDSYRVGLEAVLRPASHQNQAEDAS